MNMHILDWSIVAGLLVFMVWAAWKTQRYSRSVADFLAANRCAGRYVLGVAEGIAGVGAISIVALFEAYYKGGFSFAWWGMLMYVVTIIVAMTGWVQYRYRETRVLTLAQLLERRYSKNFRIFAGIVIFVSGTINFGIFPAVGSRFFMYFCGLKPIMVQAGPLEIDLMMAAIMIVLLFFALLFTFMGGQIAVIVTDFIQGSLFNALLCVTVVVLICQFPWDTIVEGLSNRPAGESLIHPFHSASTTDFNIWYYLIQSVGIFYCFMAWQGNQGYYASARNAHEARMGRIMGGWRDMTQRMLIMLIPLCAYAVMHHPNWAETAGSVQGVLDGIGNETLQKQLTTTTVLSKILPIGIMGSFTAVMLAAFISTHDTYLHSWGSIFVQDVLLPFRKTHVKQEDHMKMLKRAIFGVATFIFFFSLLFPQDSPVFMYFALTGTIWLGGAGAVIVGGLYWKRGTTAGAYGALLTGVVTALVGFFLPRHWEQWFGVAFPLNAQWLWFIAMVSSTIVYVLISLLGKRNVCDMDKLLNRGAYAVEDDKTEVEQAASRGFLALIGINSDFNFKDKVVYIVLSGWTVAWGVIFLAGTLYNIVNDVSHETWAGFWHFYVWLVLVSGIITTVWFTIGGCFDLKHMFKRLKQVKFDEEDDGTVKVHVGSGGGPEEL